MILLLLVFVGKVLIYEGYLKEVAILNSFGFIVELFSKGLGWRRGILFLKLIFITDMFVEMRFLVVVIVRYMYVFYLF